jgi:hypothetical protein
MNKKSKAGRKTKLTKSVLNALRDQAVVTEKEFREQFEQE